MTRFLFIPLLLLILLTGCRTVSVNVTPQGAEIKIDDKTLRPPVQLTIYPFSPKNLSISAKGCATVTQTLSFSDPAELNIVLNRQFEVKSNPSDVDVLLNGTPKGRTPFSFELPSNQKDATISFKKEGFISRNITFSPANAKVPPVIYARLVPKAPGLQNWQVFPVKYGRAVVFPDTVPEKKVTVEPGNPDIESIVELEGEQIQILGYDLLPGQNALLASILVQPQPKNSASSMVLRLLKSLQSNIAEMHTETSESTMLNQLDIFLTKMLGKQPSMEARLMIIPLEKGKKQTTLTTGNIDIAPTSDGHRIFFASNRTGRLDLWKCNLDDNLPTPKLHLIHSSEPAILATKLSPDGNNALLTIYKQEALSQPQIWLCPLNENKHIIPSFFCDGQNPAWNPDGKRIAFQKAIPTEPDQADQNKKKLTDAIFQIESDGSFPKQLTPSKHASFKHPAWSPDGKRIAYSTNYNSSESNTQSPNSRFDFHIWIMDADGSNLRQVTNSNSMDDMPVWAPDGNSIYFRSNRNLHWGIWKVQAPSPSN